LPAWYAQLGPDIIDSGLRGRNIGAQLMAPVLKAADAAMLPCYLETPFSQTLPFYRKLGYEATSEPRPFTGAPQLWATTRKAEAGTMTMVGIVESLWRFPVKSMRGEQLGETAVTGRGVLGDRAYALIDTDTGRVVSAKSAKLYPNILNCGAKFVEPPRSDADMPPVHISLPDGTVLRSDATDVDRALSAYFRRNVALRRSAPEDFTVDQYHPDVEGADPAGNRDAVVPQKLGSALFASLEMESPLPVGSFLDVFPVSVLTSSTLAKLTRQQPQSRFDVRRFRMNVILKTESDGFVENEWIGHTLGFGETTRLSVALHDPRCVMVTLAQDDLPRDTDILKALVRDNRVQLGDLGAFPCAGVYAVVAASGAIRVGAKVGLN
jgi:uncharacterized protein YcbX